MYNWPSWWPNRYRLMLVLNYLQTMENVFARSSKVLIDSESSGNVLYLPLGSMGANASGGNALMPPIVTPDKGPVGENQATSRTSRREGRQ